MRLFQRLAWQLLLATLLAACSSSTPVDEGPADNPDAATSEPTKEPFVFNHMAVTTLQSLVQHAVNDEAQWYFTAMGDTTGFAPRALIGYGQALEIGELVDLGVMTADTYLEWANEVMQRWAAGQPVEDELGLVFAGAPSLVDAYTHTGDRHYLDFLSYRLVQVNEMILDDPSLIKPGGDFAIYGPFFTGGAIIALNAELAYSFARIEGYSDPVRSELLEQASQLLTAFDDYRQVGGYYAKDATTAMEAADNCNMLMAIAALYRATGQQSYREQAQQLLAALEPLWDDEQGAYLNLASSEYIGLAENNVIVYAQLLLYEAGGEQLAPHAITRAKRFYEYVERELFRELPSEVSGGGPPGHETEGGFAVMLHDNEGAVSQWYWCSGCNFFALNNILYLNQLLGNAPPLAD